jgi:hypothetical protein
VHTETLAFHPLALVDEGDDVVVGRTDTQSFVVLPRDGAELLRRLADGVPPAEAGRWYEEEYGEQVDLDDFIASMDELGFVAPSPTADTVALAPAPATPLRWQRLGRRLLGRPALAGYLVVIAAGAAAMAIHPNLRPAPQQIFFTSSLTPVVLLAVFGQMPLLLAHEAFHALAGRKIGIPSRLLVSHRLYFIVFETDLTGLLSVPRRRRYLCFLAGTLMDLLLISVFTLLAGWLHDDAGGPGLLGRICLALAFPILIRIGYQGVFLLRTDLYYVFVTALGCHDLDGAANARLRRWWAGVLRRPLPPEKDEYVARDVRLARWYAPLKFTGILILLVIWVFGLLPVFEQMIRLLAGTFSHGTHDPHFLDRAVFVAVNLAQLLVLAGLAVRDRRAKGQS